MAAIIGMVYQRRFLHQNRIFHDSMNPLDMYSCVDLYKKYHSFRHDILRIVDDVGDEFQRANREHAVQAL